MMFFFIFKKKKLILTERKNLRKQQHISKAREPAALRVIQVPRDREHDEAGAPSAPKS